MPLEKVKQQIIARIKCLKERVISITTSDTIDLIRAEVEMVENKKKEEGRK